MFTPVHTDIKSALLIGENSIRIDVNSAENESSYSESQLSLCNTAHAISNSIAEPKSGKKSAVSWRLGLGPCLMVSGIYDEVYIESYSQGEITNWNIDYTLDKDDANIVLSIDYFALEDTEQVFTVHFDTQEIIFTKNLTMGQNFIQHNFTLKNIQRWWPNGYGEQKLYVFTLIYKSKHLSKQLGFRDLELVSEKDSIGQSFYFKVNGQDIVCRGSNWIPLDALPSKTQVIIATLNYLRMQQKPI